MPRKLIKVVLVGNMYLKCYEIVTITMLGTNYENKINSVK